MPVVPRRFCHHLLRPRPALRSPCTYNNTHRRRLFSAQKRAVSDPLRILYCGSDHFSCASLRALHDEQQRNGELIESIDVVVRPAKRTGRGLKMLSQVPLQSLAKELELPVHVRDTFTGWTMPQPINLIVAVSFGLFVPPRLLKAAKYGGLNVHPSLIPDLRGPAPVHHAILAGRTHTGLTLQTLDDKSFDHGIPLAQTPLPGIPIPEGADTAALSSLLARHGAGMLVNGLRDGLHVAPFEDVGWKPAAGEAAGLLHARKLVKNDMRVRWGVHDAQDVARMSRAALGMPWAEIVYLASGGSSSGSSSSSNNNNTKRVILENVRAASPGESDGLARAGRLRWREDTQDGAAAYFDLEASVKGDDVYVSLPSTRGVIRIGRVKVEGKPSLRARQALGPFLTST